ncbi:RNA polymerase sigma-70 factor (ECF subfamily) [Nocardioides thalensis]|uniref:RNA polymerase sigma-70 factor (ECF subfamily) n=1 Tax=Nocardioides thalensis TaxID=1914755 RepID=A0A853C675_9ACTN|nr:sigma-70 family RNA polymerase sigma factor [Nocardioides thalensis]NYJ03004.1 RNA polymerase sigma-70 factor (ECF subfamily) [Nocardioides thalensis]
MTASQTATRQQQAGPDHPPTARADHYRRLYLAHFGGILGYAVRRVDSRADAADVVSETFLVAWRRLDDAPPGEERPWLYGIARNVLANHHRSVRRRGRLGARLRDVLAEDVVPDPADGVVERDRVREALGRLSADDRELLTLVAWDGLSAPEAAQVLGIAPGATRMRLTRARRRFAEALGDSPPGDGHDTPTTHRDAPEEER